MVLDAWAASPARFREDANAEEALAVGGYAGRVLIELASNAADAARELGVPARIRVRLHDDELRVANTGSSLTAAGVAALSSLRASAKRDTHDSVGHFGVGFTAVLSWTDAPQVVSTTGGIRFAAVDTAAEVAALHHAELDGEVAARGGLVPVLRLPWPIDTSERPPPGYVTEVRLPLAPAVRETVEQILSDDRTAEDLFWALYRSDQNDLVEIDLPDGVVSCGADANGIVVIDDGVAPRHYRTAERTGRIPPDLLTDRPVEERDRSRWRVTWALPVAGVGADATTDDQFAMVMTPPDAGFVSANSRGVTSGDRTSNTIGAPTPTDEPLTLPARLIGTFPVDDTRRRLAAGPLTDHLLDHAADAYLGLIGGAEPADRWELLPVSGFPAGPIDGGLRAAVLDRVERTRLFVTAVGDLVTPGEACLLPGLGDAGAALIGEAIPGLLPPVSAAAATALRGVGVQTITWSQASAALAGIEREPEFWWQVYEAAWTAERPPVAEDLADIPIPLSNGRRALGARGCLLPALLERTAAWGDDTSATTIQTELGRSERRGSGVQSSGHRGSETRDREQLAPGERITAELARRVGDVVPDLRIIDPSAAHPLLERLGAQPADADTLLADPGLNAVLDRIRRELEDADPDPDDLREIAVMVLDLLAAGGRAGRANGPAETTEHHPSNTDRALLAELVLTDDDGQPWPAAELLVPGAALATVLLADADRPVVGREWSERYSTEVLVAAGVRSGFAIVQVDDPDDDAVDLPDLDEWVARRGSDLGIGDFEPIAALGDLDLVDPEKWEAALALIAGDREARACLAPSAAGPSYTGWWLSRHARIADAAPADWRLPGALELDGLFDVLPIDLDERFATAIGVRADLAGAAADDAEDLLDRLADPARLVAASRVASITAAIVAALADRDDVDLPSGVRTATGEVIDAADALVLDQPWLVQVLEAARLVPGGGDPGQVGHVLDLPLASASVNAVVTDREAGDGSTEDHTEQARGRLQRASAAVGLRPADIDVDIRVGLRVSVDGAEPVPVRWWADQGRWWTDGSAAGSGRVAACAAGLWALRHRAIAAAAEDWSSVAEDGIG